MPRTRSQTKDGTKSLISQNFSVKSRTRTTVKSNLFASKSLYSNNKKLKNDEGKAIIAPVQYTTSSQKIRKTRKRNADSNSSAVSIASSAISTISSFSTISNQSSKENIKQIKNCIQAKIDSKNKKPLTNFENRKNVQIIQPIKRPLTLTPDVADSGQASVDSSFADLVTNEKFDFTKSPKDPKNAIKQLENYSKRPKMSVSPRGILKEKTTYVKEKDENVKSVADSPPVTKNTNTTFNEIKKLSIAERIARIKQQNEKLKSQKSNEQQLPATPKPDLSNRIAAIKAKMAKNKVERNENKQQREQLLNQVVEAKKLAQVEMVSISREILESINLKILRNLKLPQNYLGLKNHFKNLDEVCYILNNRKESINLGRLERDLSRYNKIEKFTPQILKTILGVKRNSFNLEWKRGLRNDESLSTSSRIKSDNYQLIIEPNLQENISIDDSILPKRPFSQDNQPTSPKKCIKLTENTPTKVSSDYKSKWIKMTIKMLQNRLEDFAKRLLGFTFKSHSNFLMKKYSLTQKQIDEKFSMSKLKRWHQDFDIKRDSMELPSLDFPLKPNCDSLYSTPTSQCSLANNQNTPMSARKLLSKFNEKVKADFKDSPMTTSTPSKFVEGKGSKYAHLPKSLREKYEKRMEKVKEDELYKENLNKVKEMQQLKSLYDIARGLKSYFIIKKAQSGPVSEIVSKLFKSAATTTNCNEIQQNVEKLCNLPNITNVKSLVLETAADGIKYLKMKQGTNLIDLNNAIKISIERVERNDG